MEKEVKNVFFGEIHAFSVTSIQDTMFDQFTRRTQINGPEVFMVTFDLRDGQCCIYLKFDAICFPVLPDPLKEGDLVQVTYWSNETVTIEHFNED